MIEWKQQKNQDGSALNGSIGKYIFFKIIEDPSTNKYKLKCRLTGIKEDLGNFKDETEAKEKVIKLFSFWFMNTNLSKWHGGGF